MANRNFEDPRWVITSKFAQWTVHSALRNPGSPIKRQAIIYDALYVVPFHELFDRDLGPIGEVEFPGWHTGAVDVLPAFQRRTGVG